MPEESVESPSENLFPGWTAEDFIDPAYRPKPEAPVERRGFFSRLRSLPGRLAEAVGIGYAVLEAREKPGASLYTTRIPAAKQSLIARLFGSRAMRDAFVPITAASDNSTMVGRREDRPWEVEQDWFVNRGKLYWDYDQLDAEVPEVADALDLFASEAMYGAEGPGGKSIEWTGDERTVAVLDAMTERLELRDGLGERIVRGFMKYGDEWRELVTAPGQGILEAGYLPPATMFPNVDPETGTWKDPLHPWIQCDPNGRETWAVFTAGQIVQFSRQVDEGYYGRSLLFSARRVAKQVKTAEDQLVILLLVRAIQRYLFEVPVGSLTPEEMQRTVDKYKRQMRRKVEYDAVNGVRRTSNRAMGAEDDIWVGYRMDKDGNYGAGVKASILQAQSTQENIDGVRHLHRKMLAALKTPGAMIGFDEDTAGRHIVNKQDVAHARAVRSSQAIARRGFKRMGQAELILHGMGGAEFDCKLPLLGTEDEGIKAEVALVRAQATATLKASGMALKSEWILGQIFGLDEKGAKEAMAPVDDQGAENDPLAAVARRLNPALAAQDGEDEEESLSVAYRAVGEIERRVARILKGRSREEIMNSVNAIAGLKGRVRSEKLSRLNGAATNGKAH